jgi:hypothetical protein
MGQSGKKTQTELSSAPTSDHRESSAIAIFRQRRRTGLSRAL